jgi:hypothetical protein
LTPLAAVLDSTAGARYPRDTGDDAGTSKHCSH